MKISFKKVEKQMLRVIKCENLCLESVTNVEKHTQHAKHNGMTEKKVCFVIISGFNSSLVIIYQIPET